MIKLYICGSLETREESYSGVRAWREASLMTAYIKWWRVISLSSFLGEKRFAKLFCSLIFHSSPVKSCEQLIGQWTAGQEDGLIVSSELNFR